MLMYINFMLRLLHPAALCRIRQIVTGIIFDNLKPDAQWTSLKPWCRLKEYFVLICLPIHTSHVSELWETSWLDSGWKQLSGNVADIVLWDFSCNLQYGSYMQYATHRSSSSTLPPYVNQTNNVNSRKLSNNVHKLITRASRCPRLELGDNILRTL